MQYLMRKLLIIFKLINLQWTHQQRKPKAMLLKCSKKVQRCIAPLQKAKKDPMKTSAHKTPEKNANKSPNSKQKTCKRKRDDFDSSQSANFQRPNFPQNPFADLIPIENELSNSFSRLKLDYGIFFGLDRSGLKKKLF